MNPSRSLRIRRWLLIGGLFAAHALLGWVAFSQLENDVLMMVVVGQVTLVAAWAMLGPDSYWLQIPRMLLLWGAAFAWPRIALAQQLEGEDFEGLFALEAILFAASLTLFAPAALWGWRLVPSEVSDRQSAAQWRQVSLRGIFVDVALAAIVLAMWRSLPEFPIGPNDWEVFTQPGALGWLIAVLFLAPLVPIVALATDCNWRHFPWWLIAVIASLAVVGVTVFSTVTPRQATVQVALALVGGLTSALVSFVVIRLAGYRLVNRRRLPEAPPPVENLL